MEENSMQNLMLGFGIPMLAQITISGRGLVFTMLYVLGIAVCLCLVWWLGVYLAGKFGAPPKFLPIWNAIFVVIAVVALICFILGLFGQTVVHWER